MIDPLYNVKRFFVGVAWSGFGARQFVDTEMLHPGLRFLHNVVVPKLWQAILADDPDLTCRLPGLADRSPVRVVLDTHLRTPPADRGPPFRASARPVMLSSPVARPTLASRSSKAGKPTPSAISLNCASSLTLPYSLTHVLPEPNCS